MRQTLVLNLVVLGFFVFLFRSIYRKRRSPQLRMWIVAYIFAMAHFGIQLWTPSSYLLQEWVSSVSLLVLFLSGLSFLLAHPVFDAPGERLRAGLLLGTGLCIFCVACVFSAPPNWAFAAAAMVPQAAAAYILWRTGWHRFTVSMLMIAASLGFYAWSVYSLYSVSPDRSVAILLTEMFAFCFVAFLDGFYRATAGAWTTGLGFAAWAAVWPVGMLVDRWAPHRVIDPEIWNVPKVVVAFGMLVILFEDEVALARRDREQYRHLFDTNPTPMWIFDKDSTRLLEANSAAIRTFGWKRTDLGELTISDLVAVSDRPAGQLLELNRLLVDDGVRSNFPVTALEGEVRAATMRFQTRRGEDLIVEATLQRAKFLGEEARLLMAKDITAQMRVHEQLVHLANHDPLTGLPNRLLLSDRLKAALATALRHGTQVAVLCLDLDRFKQINDSFGHAAGDSCLSEVARRLRSRLRAMDTAARTGGEEFVVVLTEVRSRADAEAVARDLLHSLSAPHFIGDTPIHLSASIGIALYPEHGQEESELWNKADAAMYRAKQSGGNRSQLHSMAS